MADVAVIKDYLQTQGLKLSLDDVAVAMLAAQTVLAIGQGEVDGGILWYAEDEVVLREWLPEAAQQGHALRQVFLALDATLQRSPAASAAVYWLGDAQILPLVQLPSLLRLAAQGQPMPAVISVSGDSALRFLPSRVAQTGWLVSIDDVADWLVDGSLIGPQPGISQLALPISDEEGQILGVVFVADERSRFCDPEAMIPWVGLALALSPFMREWLPNNNAHTDNLNQQEEIQ